MAQDIPVSKRLPKLQEKQDGHYALFVAMLCLLHSNTNMKEISLHESSVWAKSCYNVCPNNQSHAKKSGGHFVTAY